MKLRDDRGTHYIVDPWGIMYVSFRMYEEWHGTRGRKKKPQWQVTIAFSRDVELYMNFKSEKDAKAQYKKVLKWIKEAN